MSMRYRIFLFVAALAGLIGTAGAVSALHRRHRPLREFDFYVLSLSWSPSYCDSAQERGGRSVQCDGGRPFSFVVHGLWPQYERGYPQYCEWPSPRLSRNIMISMLDLMPAPRLIYNEWDKHGTCSGLDQRTYFETVRRAHDAVNIPPEFQELSEPKTIAPGALVDAFIRANPSLSPNAIAVTCNRRRLSEVRICMSKDLQFRDCTGIHRQSCDRDEVIMPPVRGG